MSHALEGKAELRDLEAIRQTCAGTEFLGYETLEADGCKVVALIKDGKPVQAIASGEEAVVILDRTPFYAESGGQPSDQGVLGDVAVLAVIDEGDTVLHVLGGALAGERVRGRVDAERRRDHRQQHHGQHLLSRAFLETTGARTISFHLGAEQAPSQKDFMGQLVGQDA
jgi:alanyl-tRNA synthetase